ncbi:MAG: heparinase II/III family protein [Clostridia bacterium]|nr:heparinase II/III family protein [Clostridia bacterium]
MSIKKWFESVLTSKKYKTIWERKKYYETSMLAHGNFDVSDPMYVTDEDFFGAYNGTEWTIKPSFDYEKHSALAAVETAAKEGNYALCKENLLQYYREKLGKLKLDKIGGQTLDERSRVKAETIFDNVFFAEYTDMLAGRITFNKKPAWRMMDMTDEIKRVAGGDLYVGEKRIKYQFIAARKDGYFVEIESRKSDHVPYVEVQSEGKTKKYYAIRDTYVVGGQPTTKFGESKKLLVEESVSSIGVGAKPVDENTKVTLIQFDFRDLPAEDKIKNAKLFLYGCMKESDAPGCVRTECDIKSLYVKSWQKSTADLDETLMDYATYDKIGSSYQNFDGEMGPRYEIDENYHIVGHKHAIGMREYLSYAYNGYLATGEEIFAFHFIRVMQAIIHNVGEYNNWVRIANLHSYIYFYTFEVAMVGHTVSLWMPYIINSRHMTPDAWTNILKHFWSCGKFLVENWDVQGEHNNYGLHYTIGLACLSMYYPEFYAVDEPLGEVKNTELPGSKVGGWKEVVKYRLAYKTLDDFFEDGHCVEIPMNYALNSVSIALRVGKVAESIGINPTEFYTDELINRLEKACLWQMYHLNPRFGEWQVGDAATFNTYQPRFFEDILKIKENPYLRYVFSNRKSGEVPPELTVMNDKPGKVTFRNSWDEMAVAAHFENSSGMALKGYGHGHNDDLSLTLAAYGQYLLVDPMMGFYDVAEIRERWASSTRGHNTIEINDAIAKGYKYYEDEVDVDLFGEPMHVPKKQYAEKPGSLFPENREINNIYDYVCGETFGYSNHNALESDYQVKRDVLFMREGYFIVTDYINPADKEKINSYVQPWHFLPDANVSVDKESYVARSHFNNAANLIVATVQKDQIEPPALKPGLYANSRNNFVETVYPYFKQKNKGVTTFCTLLYPLPAEKDAVVTTKSLSLDVSDAFANAFCTTIHNVQDDTIKIIHYYNLFDQAKKACRIFGNYATDGNLVLVDETDGVVKTAIIRSGAELKRVKDEIYLICSKTEIEDLSVTWKGESVYLSGSKLNEALMSSLKIMAQEPVAAVYLNGIPIEFMQCDNNIYFDKDKF